MTIPFPTPQFPAALLEVGPQEDRTILLRGIAEIAGSFYDVVAIRIDPITMGADFRDDLSRSVYANHRVQDLLEDVGEHTEITDASLLHLSSGRYVLIMLPSTETRVE